MILKDLNKENDHFVRTPEDRSSKAMDRFKNVLLGVSMLGWETYGKIRPEPGQFRGFHNTTSVVLLPAKGDRK